MNRFRKPLIFTLALLPIAAVAAVFTCLYQFEIYPAEIFEDAVSEIGSIEAVIAISVVQVIMYAAVCGFFGCILAGKTGLWIPFRFETRKIAVTLAVSAVLGIIFSLDYWVFGAFIPEIKAADAVNITASNFIASVLYGGIIEEVMMRLFFMSLLAFIIWKLFFRTKRYIPEGVFTLANAISAILFAAGHLPATVMTFGALTPMLLFRCFLLNGGFGFAFGMLYSRYGIWYAMLAHASVHIVSKLIWIIFI